MRLRPIAALPVILALGAAAGAALAQSPPAPDAVARGKAFFESQCLDCHSAPPDETGGEEGPPLNGVIGRKIGGAPNFSYTKALGAKDGNWTPESLDAFLANPTSVVPGTAMTIAVPDKDRADLIAFLASTK